MCLSLAPKRRLSRRNCHRIATLGRSIGGNHCYIRRAAYRGAELRIRPSDLAPYRLSPRRIRYLADGVAVSGFVMSAHECSSRAVPVFPLDAPSPYGAAWKYPPNTPAAPPSFSACAKLRSFFFDRSALRPHPCSVIQHLPYWSSAVKLRVLVWAGALTRGLSTVHRRGAQSARRDPLPWEILR
jgi:hypothetical protein